MRVTGIIECVRCNHQDFIDVVDSQAECRLFHCDDLRGVQARIPAHNREPLGSTPIPATTQGDSHA